MKYRDYFVDDKGSVWVGPIEADNLHYGRIEGVYNAESQRSGEPVVIARRTDPDPNWFQVARFE